MAKTTAQNTPTRKNNYRAHPVAAAVNIPNETHVFLNASGYATPIPAAGYTYAGLARKDADNSDGDAGDIFVETETDIEVLITGSGFALTSVGLRCYLSDNYTGTLTMGDNIDIGEIVEYVSSTQVWVRISKARVGNDIPVRAANGVAGPSSTFAGLAPIAAQQALSGAGAINVTSFYTAWTSTGANAGTLANGVVKGQLKKVQLIVDGGDATLTPTSLSGGTTITFADAGDYALLQWNGTAWVAIELGNDADGATAPVLA